MLSGDVVLPPVELVRVDELTPYTRNAKNHPDEQIDQIVASIREFKFVNPILIDQNGEVLAGHGRLLAAIKLGLKTVPCIRWKHLNEKQRQAFRLADNRIAENALWNLDFLRLELNDLDSEGFQIDLLGFENWEMDNLLRPIGSVTINTPEGDDIPDAPTNIKTRTGDIWICGNHRVMCGDSTDPKQVSQLVGRKKAEAIHADPPYGMGKEKEGVVNDNLRGHKLDDFQNQWWAAWRPKIEDTASIYIWGNAPDLWRFYWTRLDGTEDISIRNEIVWDKESAFGQSSESQRCYSPGTERLLFLMLGLQGFGNVNTKDFFEGFEPLRCYLAGEFKKMGWGPKECHKIVGVQMLGHWITKSQWQMPARKHYERLQSNARGGAFAKHYGELRQEFEHAKHGGKHLTKQRNFQSNRGYFDNTHANMTDVWRFPRVAGSDRHGHATPKPVDIMARICNSSVPKGGLILEPFAGTGSTLIGAEVTDRRCFTMELERAYCDVTVQRWQDLTGKTAKRKSDGKTFKQAKTTT